MAGHRGGAEAGQVGRRDLGGRLAERVDRRQPARAEHQGDVVPLDAGQLGEAAAACSASSYGEGLGVSVMPRTLATVVCLRTRWSAAWGTRPGGGCWIGRMIDHFGINVHRHGRRPAPSTTRCSASSATGASWTSAWPSATAPTSPTSGSRPSRASAPTARCTSRSRRRTPTTCARSSPPPWRWAPRCCTSRGCGRSTTTRYYGGFVRDTEGNNVEAVCHRGRVTPPVEDPRPGRLARHARPCGRRFVEALAARHLDRQVAHAQSPAPAGRRRRAAT